MHYITPGPLVDVEVATDPTYAHMTTPELRKQIKSHRLKACPSTAGMKRDSLVRVLAKLEAEVLAQAEVVHASMMPSKGAQKAADKKAMKEAKAGMKDTFAYIKAYQVGKTVKEKAALEAEMKENKALDAELMKVERQMNAEAAKAEKKLAKEKRKAESAADFAKVLEAQAATAAATKKEKAEATAARKAAAKENKKLDVELMKVERDMNKKADEALDAELVKVERKMKIKESQARYAALSPEAKAAVNAAGQARIAKINAAKMNIPTIVMSEVAHVQRPGKGKKMIAVQVASEAPKKGKVAAAAAAIEEKIEKKKRPLTPWNKFVEANVGKGPGKMTLKEASAEARAQGIIK